VKAVPAGRFGNTGRRVCGRRCCNSWSVRHCVEHDTVAVRSHPLDLKAKIVDEIISNDELEGTIAKGSLRRSKWTYYLLYLEFRIKRY
jgi:hypothetical protein